MKKIWAPYKSNFFGIDDIFIILTLIGPIFHMEYFGTNIYNNEVEVKFVLQISRPPANGASLERFLRAN